MPKPYDAAAKDLITRYPADWAAAFGLRTDGPVEVLSPDLSAVTASADVLIRAGGEVLHVDAESGPDPNLPLPTTGRCPFTPSVAVRVGAIGNRASSRRNRTSRPAAAPC